MKKKFTSIFYIFGLAFLLGENSKIAVFAEDGGNDARIAVSVPSDSGKNRGTATTADVTTAQLPPPLADSDAGVESLSSSQLQAQKKPPIKAKLKRMNSLPNMLLKQPDPAMTSEQREDALIEAMKTQGVDLSDLMSNKESSDEHMLIGLREFSQKLKAVKIEVNGRSENSQLKDASSQEKVYMIDISWPNIRDKLLISAKIAEDTKKLLRQFEIDPEDRTKTKFNTNEILHELTSEEIDKLINAIAVEKLFDISKLTAEQQETFNKVLKTALSNSSGFQKIASALVVKVCNDCPSFTIKQCSEEQQREVEAYYNSDSNVIFLPLDGESLDYEAATFIHELSHGFHHSLSNWLFMLLDYSMPFVTRSILNSKTFDLKGIFFPYFSEAKMDKAIYRIESFIEGKELDKAKATKLLKDLVKWGFGSLILTDADKNKSAIDIYSPKVMARAIYVASQTEYNSNYETTWNNGMEMLAITGMLPLKVGNELFIVSDRSNEIIFGKRMLDDSDNEYENESALGLYRNHMFEEYSKEEVDTRIKANIENLYGKKNDGSSIANGGNSTSSLFQQKGRVQEGSDFEISEEFMPLTEMEEAQLPDQMLHVDTAELVYSIGKDLIDPLNSNAENVYKTISDTIESAYRDEDIQNMLQGRIPFDQQKILDAFYKALGADEAKALDEKVITLADLLIRLAIYRKDNNVLAFLVSKIADLKDKTDLYRVSILYYAVREAPYLVDTILSKGGDPNVRYKEGYYTAYEYPLIWLALNNGDDDLLQKLLDRGANLDAKYRDSYSGCEYPLIWLALNNGDDDLLQKFLDRGANLDAKYRDYYSGCEYPLIWLALNNGDNDLLQKLFSKGADPNAKYMDFEGKNQPLLRLAIDMGNYNLVKLLLDAGARADGTYIDADNQEQPLLKLAIEQKDKWIVECLLKAKTSAAKAEGTYIYDKCKQQSLLKLAIDMGNDDIVELLLDAGAKANGTYIDGNGKQQSLLRLAIEQKGDFGIVEALLKAKNNAAKANGTYIDERGKEQPWLKLAIEKKPIVVVFLLQAQAQANGMYIDNNDKIQPLLKLAIEEMEYSAVSVLLEAGAPANGRYIDEDGIEQPLLKLAIEKVARLIVTYLLEAKTNAAEATGSYTDKQGEKRPLLHFAKNLPVSHWKEEAKKDIIQFLVNHGAKE